MNGAKGKSKLIIWKNRLTLPKDIKLSSKDRKY